MDRNDLEAYVDAMSKAVGLPVADEYRAGVADVLAAIFAQSEALSHLALDLTEEAALVFTP